MRALIVVMLLASCAKPTVWVHDPPSTQRQLSHDAAKCNAMGSRVSAGTDGLMGVAMFMNERDMCMVGEGWTKVAQ